jgi:hypothetical protein
LDVMSRVIDWRIVGHRSLLCVGLECDGFACAVAR